MIGPGPVTSGSRDVDAALNLIQIIQNPDAYKAKIEDLAKQIDNATKRQKEAQDAEAKAINEQKSATDAMASLQKERLSLENDLKRKIAENDKLKEDLEGRIQNSLEMVNKKLTEYQNLQDNLAKQRQELVNWNVQLKEQSRILDSQRQALGVDRAEIERKKAILSQL